MEPRETRGAFKFFASYLAAAQMLTNKEDQADFLMAICEYGITGVEPQIAGTGAALFMLAKPNIDASNKKSDSGASGGKANSKQTASKPEANRKQTESKPEANSKQTSSKTEPEEGSRKKEEGRKEVGSRNTPPKSPRGEDFEVFWQAYPKKVGKQAAKKAFEKVTVPVESLVSAIKRQECSPQWSKDDGQYIPNPATWLNQGRWEDEMTVSAPAVGFTPGVEEAATIARLRKLRSEGAV